MYTKNVCICCGKPFTRENVWTAAGWRETTITGFCERCFDLHIGEPEEEEEEENQEEEADLL